MFRSIRTLLPSLAALLLVAACSDLPTSTLPPAADLDRYGPVQENSVECGSDTDPCLLPPAGNDPGDTDPGCDPYLTLSGCGDECAESFPGDPQKVVAEGCIGGGGGGGGGTGGGDPYLGGGGTVPPPPPAPCPESDPNCPAGSYDQGFLLWGACVLAVTGATYSVSEVAGAFQTWYNATGRLSAAERELQMVQANYLDRVDHATLLLYQYQRDQAQREYDSAKAAVSGATNVSYFALGGAALACGASLFLPTP